MWFQDRHDEGVVFATNFCPFPIPALALVLSVICGFNFYCMTVDLSVSFRSNVALMSGSPVSNQTYSFPQSCMVMFMQSVSNNWRNLEHTTLKPDAICLSQF
jgi:hypothetical protein